MVKSPDIIALLHLEAMSHNQKKEEWQFNTMDRGKISIEEFFALLDRDPEHRYELIDGYPSLMTGRSPDHRCKSCRYLPRAVAEVHEKTTFDDTFAEA